MTDDQIIEIAKQHGLIIPRSELRNGVFVEVTQPRSKHETKLIAFVRNVLDINEKTTAPAVR